MKKNFVFSFILIMAMFAVPVTTMAASGVIFDFSQMQINDSSLPFSEAQGTWGNLGGSRISSIKSGEYDLISDKKYLEIVNTTQPEKLGKCSNQFKDYVNLNEGETLWMTATVMIKDMNFAEVGLYATRANVRYVDAEGKEGSIADIDFNGGPPLVAIANTDGAVWLNSWGNDITPEDFSFELNRLYKLDALFKGGSSVIDVYLDGKYVQAVDYSEKFSDMVKSNIGYNFNDTSKYQSYRISQVKRLAVAQHKPSDSTVDQVSGWYNVGYQVYGAADVVPPITFKNDDLDVKQNSEIVTKYEKGIKLVMKQKASKISDVMNIFAGEGTIRLYKDKNCTKEYSENEWISFPSYLEYFDVSGFRTLLIPIVSDFYADNSEIKLIGNTASFSGRMVNIGNEQKSSVIIIACYSDMELVAVKMLELDVNANDVKPFTVSLNVGSECNEVLAWTFDTWESRNILSDIFRLNI